MNLFRFEAAAMSLLVVLGAGAADTPASRPLLPEALGHRTAEVQQAEKDYADAVLEANKTYLAAIDAALKEALKKEDLERANRLKAERDEINADSAELKAGVKRATSKASFVLKSARYGFGNKWVDLTKNLAPLVKGGALEIPNHLHDYFHLPDPVDGKPKMVVVEYVYNGTTMVVRLDNSGTGTSRIGKAD